MEKTMEKIVALAKARGFVYPGSEIYGGLANTWDYGNLGVELKNNVKKAWWKKFVQENKYNVGVDFGVLNSRLSVTAEYYYEKNREILMNLAQEVAYYVGTQSASTNLGKMDSWGGELSITWRDKIGSDFNYSIGYNVAYNKNQVTKVNSERKYNPGGENVLSQGTTYLARFEEGQPIGYFWGYKTDGVIQNASELDAYLASLGGNKSNSLQGDALKVGDLKFVDYNGDGVINDDDKAVIGNPNPDLYGNIFAKVSYKRFTLNVGFNYSLNNDVYNYQRSILNSGSTLFNQQVAEINHWRYEGQQASLPKVAYGDPMGNNRFSDRWIEDGSYLRLKTVALTYQIPIPESWQSWLQGISVWGEAHNIFTLTHYTGNDPEFSVGNGQLYQGIDCGYLSQSRSFTLGVKINL